MIGIATNGKFGGAVTTNYVVSGTPEYVIDPTSLSFEAIYGNLKAWVDARPDADTWQDYFDSGTGVTVLELLAGMSTFLAFRIIASRKETYLQYAETLAANKAVAQTLGYSVNRGTNKHLTLTIVPSSTTTLARYTIVGAVQGVDLVLASSTGLISGVSTSIEVIVGDKKSENYSITSSALQWFRFISTNVSEDFRLLLNNSEVPKSTDVGDLLNDKYISLSNAQGAIDAVYYNIGSYQYNSGDILTLEYIENATPTFTINDLTFDYGVISALDATVDAIEAETVTDIRVNAPLFHETQLLIRGRDDYEKTFKLLNPEFTSTNGYDVSAAVLDLTYVLDDLDYLTTAQDAVYINSLSNYRPFGVQPPTISDPTRVYYTITVTITLLATTTTAQVQTDVDIVMDTYEKELEATIDLQAIENSLEDYSYVKIARIVMQTTTWTALTYYARGNMIKAVVDTGYDYEATSFSSSVSADIIAVAADDIINDEGFTLTRNDGTTKVFKFSKDSGTVTGQDVTISITSGETDIQVAILIETAVNSVGAFSATTASPDYTITVVRKEGGASNRTNSDTVSNSIFSVDDFTGRKSSGVEPSSWPTTAGAIVVDNDITWTCRTREASPPQLAWNEFCTITAEVTLV